jgi:hypothetical protein
VCDARSAQTPPMHAIICGTETPGQSTFAAVVLAAGTGAQPSPTQPGVPTAQPLYITVAPWATRAASAGQVATCRRTRNKAKGQVGSWFDLDLVEARAAPASPQVRALALAPAPRGRWRTDFSVPPP